MQRDALSSLLYLSLQFVAFASQVTDFRRPFFNFVAEFGRFRLVLMSLLPQCFGYVAAFFELFYVNSKM